MNPKPRTGRFRSRQRLSSLICQMFGTQPSSVGSQPSTLNSRQSEKGIALIITLGILTVILLIAVAFALSARTEAKSGSSYDNLVASKSFAKMGLDRCLMELVAQNNSTPYSGKSSNYSSNDLTFLPGSTATNYDTTPEFGAAPAYSRDFVNVDTDPLRGASEPYWIGVTNAQGKLIGRFAYTTVKSDSGSGGSSSGSGTTLMDINSIGNIWGSGDAYVRSNGFVGVTNNSYTRGIAADVNLIAFLQMLGYADPTNVAWRILAYRYGWAGGASDPPANTYKPGDVGTDENGDSRTDNPQEYDPVQLRGSGGNVDRAISDLAQVQSVLSVADLANSNLATYATISSSDLNKFNAYGATRIPLNSMTNLSDLPTVWNVLHTALPTYDTNQLCQWAVNIVDFRSTNTYPTIWANAGTGGTNTFIGIRKTPYLSQVRYRYDFGFRTNGANWELVVSNANYAIELWYPYPGTFPAACTVVVTNVMTMVSTPSLGSFTNVASYTWAANTVSNHMGITSGTSFINITPFAGAMVATNSTGYITATFSNHLTYVVYGASAANTIQYGSGDSVPSLLGTAIAGATSNISNASLNKLFFNCEADDPRIGYLYAQPTDPGSALNWYTYAGYPPTAANMDPDAATRGTNWATWTAYGGPDGKVTLPLTTNREGLASFYLKSSNYVNIGEIGSVYRGEPRSGSNAVGAFQTIRLQPGGEGGILDYVRVNELNEVHGRVNLNSDTNGPLGSYQSPALWALFKGLTNPVYGTLSDTKISNTIVELATYRSSLTNILSGVTNFVYTNIGQVCEISNLVYNSTWGDISSTNDFAREFLASSIADLISTRAESGSEIIAWGQVIKGNQPAGTIQIRAWYTKQNGHISLTKFQYVKQQ